MGKVIRRNQPCLDIARCGSSDARQVYEDGGSKCFSCNKSFKASEDTEGTSTNMAKNSNEEFEEEETTRVQKFTDGKDVVDYTAKLEEIGSLGSRGFQERHITKTVASFFNVKVDYNSDGTIKTHYYPYLSEEGIGYKVRKLPKSFSFVGAFSGLFGKDIFANGGKRVVITEGEIDAMSVAQAYHSRNQIIYPAVSVKAGVDTKALIENREWLRSFDEIILFFDNDEVGLALTLKAISILGVDKVRIPKYPSGCKDPNEILVKEGGDKLLRCIWDAEKHQPAGIMGRSALKTAMKAKNAVKSVPYPEAMRGVQSKTKGMRKSEIALYISGTGSGKSTMIRQNILNILEITDDKVGIISLEETPGETARNLSAMAIARNHSAEEIPDEDMDVGFDKVFGVDGEDERVIVLDHQGSIKDDSIVAQLEYMALMGCGYLFIDHITILVSEGAEGLTGNEAIDKIMNDLLRIAKKYDVHIGLVSHLRKASSGNKSFEEGRLPSIDDIKGSGSIKQVCLDIIAFARNMTADNEPERNTLSMSVLKCRHTGLTGPVPGAYYNYKTGLLVGLEDAPEEDFKIID